MKATDLQWGLKLPELEAPALWGARCVLEGWTDARGKRHVDLDILWDRQEVKADEKEAELRLLAHLNTHGAIEHLRQAIRKRKPWFDPASEEVRVVTIDGVEFHCSSRASHGYLYITARLAVRS